MQMCVALLQRDVLCATLTVMMVLLCSMYTCWWRLLSAFCASMFDATLTYPTTKERCSFLPSSTRLPRVATTYVMDTFRYCRCD